MKNENLSLTNFIGRKLQFCQEKIAPSPSGSGPGKNHNHKRWVNSLFSEARIYAKDSLAT
jgi:hypothetical protein